MKESSKVFKSALLKYKRYKKGIFSQSLKSLRASFEAWPTERVCHAPQLCYAGFPSS